MSDEYEENEDKNEEKELESFVKINIESMSLDELEELLLEYNVQDIDLSDIKTDDGKRDKIIKIIFANDDIVCDLKRQAYALLNDEPEPYEIVDVLVEDKTFVHPTEFLRDGITLFDHQMDALNFMNECEECKFEKICTDPGDGNHGIKGGLLNLQMGMGKTLISLLYCLCTRQNSYYPSLVVTKKSLVTEWKENVENLLKPEFAERVYYLHSSINVDLSSLTTENIDKYDIIVTTYDVCRNACSSKNFWANNFKVLKTSELEEEEKQSRSKHIFVYKQESGVKRENLKGVDVIYGVPWVRVICDESHKLANDQSQIYRAIMSISTLYSWCLSGTPFKNYSSDIWSQLRFLGYDDVENPSEFSMKLYNEQKLYNNVLTVTYEDYNIQMVNKIEHDIKCEFSANEKYLYLVMYNFLLEKIKMAKEKKLLYGDVLASFLRLRQICIIPRLVLEKYPQPANIPMLMKDDGDFYGKCAKMKKTVDIVHEVLERKEKVIIFSQFSKSLKMCKDILQAYEIESELITGDTYTSTRDFIFDKFKNGNLDVLLINYVVGSEGLTLVEANNCIMLEPYWADYIHRQAYGRIWRITQKKDCNIYYLYINNSVEDRILDICHNKNVEEKQFLQKDDDFGQKKQTLSLSHISELLTSQISDVVIHIDDGVKREIEKFCAFIEEKVSESNRQKIEKEKVKKQDAIRVKKEKLTEPVFNRKKCEYK